MGSSAAATCMSAWVSTPPVMARRSSTMVNAIPFLWLKGWHAPAGRRTCEPRPLAQDGQIRPARRWVPQKPGPGRRIVSRTARTGVSRFGGQAGTQAPDPTPEPPQNHGSRAGAGSTTHILPADLALVWSARPVWRSARRLDNSVCAGSAGRCSPSQHESASAEPKMITREFSRSCLDGRSLVTSEDDRYQLPAAAYVQVTSAVPATPESP